VGERGLSSCAECAEFPCPAYDEWAKSDDGHAAAFERLKQMQAQR
jgi:hypothetical protein